MKENLMICGKELSQEDRKKALARYVHRFTGDHVPKWAHTPTPNGKFCPVQFKDDAEWLDHTLFPVNKSGKLISGDCQAFPTWPKGRHLFGTDEKPV